ncbi:MAG: hypothetical protein HRT87_11540 [Legionellales bacterium]|nr:hypothetical protein [Legionellales bacterium]
MRKFMILILISFPIVHATLLSESKYIEIKLLAYTHGSGYYKIIYDKIVYNVIINEEENEIAPTSVIEARLKNDIGILGTTNTHIFLMDSFPSHINSYSEQYKIFILHGDLKRNSKSDREFSIKRGISKHIYMKDMKAYTIKIIKDLRLLNPEEMRFALKFWLC